MYEIKDEDIQLSENFKKAQLKLETKKQELISLNKKENNDTIEASLLFISNSAYFKELTKGQLIVNKPDIIKKHLIREFPKLDIKYVDKVLIKHGYFNYIHYMTFFSVIFLIIYLVTVIGLINQYGFSLSVFITKILLSGCFFLIILLLIDYWIVLIKR